MNRPIRWMAILCLACGLSALAIWASTRARADSDEARAAAATAPSRISHDSQGQTIITLTPAEQSRGGIEAAPLKAEEFRAQVQAIGVLQEDPSQTFVLRAPMAGTLEAVPGKPWPSLGQTLADGAQVAVIEPRFVPFETVDLSSKLATAEADVAAATAALAASKANYQRAYTLNLENKNISDQAVQDAGAVMAADESKLGAARQTVKLIRQAMGAATQPAGTPPLAVSQGGQVTELAMRPGEAVEPGQVLLRTTRFDSMLAAVSLSPTQHVDPATATAQVIVAGYDDHPLPVDRIELAPSVDPKTLGQTLLLPVCTDHLGLRPGTPVTATLDIGEARQGVLVPSSAIVWHDQKAWAYVRMGASQFVRRQVPTDDPAPNGYFVTTSFHPQEAIVVRGAQDLLSEEFKPVIPAGGDVDTD